MESTCIATVTAGTSFTYLCNCSVKNLELWNNNLHNNIVAVYCTTNLNVHIYIVDTDHGCYTNRDNYFPAIHYFVWLKKMIR